MERKFDDFATSIAQKYNYPQIPYDKLTKAILLIYLIITQFSMYYRPDFMSCTAVAIGIYAVMNPHNITRQLFRILVVFLFITFIYDFIYLIFIHSSEAVD